MRLSLRKTLPFALSLFFATAAFALCAGPQTTYYVKDYLTRGACPDETMNSSYWQQFDTQDLESTINTGFPVSGTDYYIQLSATGQSYAGIAPTYSLAINGVTIYNTTATCTGTNFGADAEYVMIPANVLTDTQTQKIRLTLTNPSYPTGGTAARAVNFYQANLLFWPHLCTPPANVHC